MARKVLVTGGSGFIGTNLVSYLSDAGNTVVSLDKATPRDPALARLHIEVDILDSTTLDAVIAEFEPSAIVHLAARTDLDGRRPDDYLANTDGTRNLLSAANRTSSVDCVLLASSRLVCEIGYRPSADDDYCPTTSYGQSKVVGEQIVRSSASPGYDWCIVRPTSIWGPWFEAPYSTFFNSVAAGHYMHPRGKQILKSFGYVGNTVHQISRLIESSAEFSGRTLYLGDSPPIEVLDWARRVALAMHAHPPREVPESVLRSVALAGDAIEKISKIKAPLTSFRLNNILTEMVYDLEPVMSVSQPLPFSVAQGVQATVEWIEGQTLPVRA